MLWVAAATGEPNAIWVVGGGGSTSPVAAHASDGCTPCARAAGAGLVEALTYIGGRENFIFGETAEGVLVSGR